MNYKQKLGYTLLGAGIMALGIIIGQVITPDIEAQSNGVFDEVKCRRLTVVDEAGEHEIILKQRSINIFNKEGQVAIRLESEDDGKHGIWIVDPLTKKYGIILATTHYFNSLMILSKPGESGISLTTDSDYLLGNTISVYDRAGNIKWSVP